jgi:hypothetical protein
MDAIPFPDTRSDRLTEEALDKLGEWVDHYIELGVNQITIIGLLDIYKTSLSFNLLGDEEDD